MNNNQSLSETIKQFISSVYGEIFHCQEVGKYVFIVAERKNRRNYPQHGFVFLGVTKRPKAKYAKYKVDFAYVQPTVQDAKAALDAKVYKFQNFDKKKIEEKQARKELNSAVKASDFYQIGDIIYNSWGYEQTNVEFYQVVRMTAKTICVEEIAQEQVPESMNGHGMSCDVIAVKDSFLKNGGKFQLQVKVFKADGDHYLAGGESFYSFGKWNGTPKYCSWYA